MSRAMSTAKPPSVDVGHPVDGVEAVRLWAGLVTYHPAVAALLAAHVRCLPEGSLPASGQSWFEKRFPEAAPYSHDGEDCPACDEVEDLCRYHQGVADGLELDARDMVSVEGARQVLVEVEALESASSQEIVKMAGRLAGVVQSLLRVIDGEGAE